MNAPLPPRVDRPRTQLLVFEPAAAPWLPLAESLLRPTETRELSVSGRNLGALAHALGPGGDRSRNAAILLSPSIARSERELLQRTRVARLLLKELVQSGTGELVLATSASATRDVRRELLALVDVFLMELGAVPVVISALFLEATSARRSVFEAGFGLPKALGQHAQELRRPAVHGAGVF